jgi:hypothetical protein
MQIFLLTCEKKYNKIIAKGSFQDLGQGKEQLPSLVILHGFLSEAKVQKNSNHICHDNPPAHSLNSSLEPACRSDQDGLSIKII